MLKQGALLILVVLAGAPTASSQSIADAARTERARRQASAQLPAGREALMDEALRVSGAKRQLEQVLESSLQSLAGNTPPKGISPQEYQETIREALNPERLMPLFETSIAGEVTEKTLADIVRWYRSPLGIEVAAAEIKANGAAASTQMQRYASTLAANPPARTRIQLLQQLEGQTQATEKTVVMLMSLVMSIYKGMTAAGLEIAPPPPDFERTFRAQVTEPMRQGIMLWFLFAYNSLSEPDLAGYIAFLKSPPAAAFNDSIWAGMNASFGEAAQFLGRKLAERKRGVQ